MKKTFTNQVGEFDICNISNNQIIDNYINFFGNNKRQINIHKKGSLKYLLILQNSELHLDINLIGEYSNIEVFCIAFGNIKSTKINANINSNNSNANVYILSFLKDGSDIDIDGAINIDKNINNIEGRLLQENIILGHKEIKLRNTPILNVLSNQVKASHGSKTYKLDGNNLFFLQSKGLNYDMSVKIIVDGYLDNIFSNFDIDTINIKKDIITKIYAENQISKN